MKINLLPVERQRGPARYRTVALLAACLLCVVSVLGYYTYNLSLRLTQIRDERDRLATAASDLTAIEVLLKEEARAQQELNRLQAEGVPAVSHLTPYIDELARLLPDAIFVSDLTFAASGMTLRGVTPNYALAAQLLRFLEGSEMFSDPVLHGLDAAPNGFRFELTVTMKVGAR